MNDKKQINRNEGQRNQNQDNQKNNQKFDVEVANELGVRYQEELKENRNKEQNRNQQNKR